MVILKGVVSIKWDNICESFEPSNTQEALKFLLDFSYYNYDDDGFLKFSLKYHQYRQATFLLLFTVTNLRHKQKRGKESIQKGMRQRER